jgi:hypothetical protein
LNFVKGHWGQAGLGVSQALRDRLRLSTKKWQQHPQRLRRHPPKRRKVVSMKGYRIHYGAEDSVNAARGMVIGLIISLPIWVVGFYLLLD